MIINLNTITDKNAHAAIVLSGHKEYHFIGRNRPDRNLIGSPLAEGPQNLLQYRAWLWSQIQAENPMIHSALRKVAVYGKVVHENKAEIAELISRAAKWYKEKVLQPAIVCTKCLVYLTDDNVGDFHLCQECAWGSSDEDLNVQEDLSFFCDYCENTLHDWLSQMYGQCQECREKRR